MSHSPSFPISISDTKHSPNPQFGEWVRKHSALYISQIATILGAVLYLGTFSYYMIGDHLFGKRTMEPKEFAGLVRPYEYGANFIAAIVFVYVMVTTLKDNDHGEYHTKMTLKRLFLDLDEKAFGKIISNGKDYVLLFKKIFLMYWVIVALYYAYVIIAQWLPASVSGKAISSIVGILSVLLLYICSLTIIDSRHGTRPSVKGLFTPNIIWKLLPLIALFVLHIFDFCYDGKSTVVLALKIVYFTLMIAILIANLDSKLLGIPSVLIGLINCYAVIQPLAILATNPMVAALGFLLSFITKIYFFIVIAYAMQTGRLLNFFCCNGLLENSIANFRNRVFN